IRSAPWLRKAARKRSWFAPWKREKKQPLPPRSSNSPAKATGRTQRGEESFQTWRQSFFFTARYSLLTDRFVLSGRVTSQPCRGQVLLCGAARPPLCRRQEQSSRRRCPSLRRATIFQSDCRTRRKFSKHRSPQICTRSPRGKVSRVAIEEGPWRPPWRPGSLQFL